MLVKDRHWAPLDGLLCEVTKFTPLAKVEDGQVIAMDRPAPYAFIDISCREGGVTLPPDASGAISHKLDFLHLWRAFVDRGIGENENIFVVWSKKNLRPSARIFSPFMPRMAVLIFKDDGYRLFRDNTYRPELRGLDRASASLPIIHWRPDVWR